MRSIKIIKSFSAVISWRTALCAVAALALASCSKERINEPGGPQQVLPGEQAKVQLRISIPDMEQVQTRSGDAEVVKIHVATFNAAGYMTDAPQEVVPIGEGPQGGTLYAASLTATAQNTPRTVVLFANAEARLDAFKNANGGSWKVLGVSGVTEATATKLSQIQVIRFDVLPISSSYITQQPQFPLPMVAEVNVNAITNGLTINADGNGNPVLLQRAVAKFTVRRDASLTDATFSLQGASLGNALSNSWLFAQNGLDNAGAVYTYSSSATSPEVLVGAVNSSETVPLYGYESSKDHPKPLFVIIKANYKGTVGYYRAEMLSGALGGVRNKLDIIRNYHYIVTVKSVENPGYTTMAEAIASRGSNINYEVTATVPGSDTQDDAHDIISNGDYFLGVSNSSYMFYADGIQNGLTVARITHNAPTTVTTASIKIEGTGLALVANTGYTVAGGVGTINKSVKTIDVKINAATTFTTALTGTVTIQLGNLTKKITIRRRPMISSMGGVLADFDDAKYVTASVVNSSDSWLRFSKSADGSNASQEINNPSGRIYPVVSPHYLFDAGAARNTTAYVSSSDDTGRTRVFVAQTYGLLELDLRYVDPSATTYAGYLDAHYESRPISINGPVAKIEILKSNGSPIGVGDEWLRFSQKSTYPLAAERASGVNQLHVSEVIDNAAGVWRYLYADENVTGSDRELKLKVTYALSESDLSTNPMAVKEYRIAQRAIELVGLFGGDFASSSEGYTKQMGVERHEEFTLAFKKGDVVKSGMIWGFNNIITSVVDKAHGMAGTKALATRIDHGVTGTLDPIYNTYPARYCYEKNRDLDGNGTLDDNELKWYLPAQNQLQAVWVSNGALTNSFSANYYWSATEYSASYSWFVSFYGGTTPSYYKTPNYRVRCVRDL